MVNSISSIAGVQEQLVSDMKSAIADAEDMLQATADQAGDKFANLRARIQERLKGAKARLADAEEALVAKSRAAARATDEYVHESPWTAIGVAAGVTPTERAERIDRLLDALGLATEPLPYPLAAVMDHLATDKKHEGGRLRWVLPTADAVTIRDDIEPALVERAAASLLAAGTGSPR